MGQGRGRWGAAGRRGVGCAVGRDGGGLLPPSRGGGLLRPLLLGLGLGLPLAGGWYLRAERHERRKMWLLLDGVGRFGRWGATAAPGGRREARDPRDQALPVRSPLLARQVAGRGHPHLGGLLVDGQRGAAGAGRGEGRN